MELWKLRNEVVHGISNNNKNTEKKMRIHAELEHIYSKRKLYLSKDQDILLPSVDEHKKLHLSSIQIWLVLYKHHLINSAKTAKKNALQGVKNITNYFSFK